MKRERFSDIEGARDKSAKQQNNERETRNA